MKKISKPPRVLIYGIEGVGKSSMIDQAPNPCAICPEGGFDQLHNTFEIPKIKSWDDVRKAVKDLITGPKKFDTLGIDSADWLEKLCHAKIIAGSGKSITTVNGGYGAGYRQAEQMHRELIEDLSELRDKHSMTIIIAAHYQVKEVKDPESIHDYQQFEIKCHEMVSSLWREWVDALLFARFETFVKGGDGNSKTIATGSDDRIMYTVKRPAFQAKNRYNLPAVLPMPKDGIWKAFADAMEEAKSEDPAPLFEKANALLQNIPFDIQAKAGPALESDRNNPVKLHEHIKKLTALQPKEA